MERHTTGGQLRLDGVELATVARDPIGTLDYHHVHTSAASEAQEFVQRVAIPLTAPRRSLHEHRHHRAAELTDERQAGADLIVGRADLLRASRDASIDGSPQRRLRV